MGKTDIKSLKREEPSILAEAKEAEKRGLL